MALSGTVDLRLHVRTCMDHEKSSRKLLDSTISGFLFDPKVMIAIGMLRWIMDYQREGDTDADGIPWR
jgi:hypothetical protein